MGVKYFYFLFFIIFPFCKSGKKIEQVINQKPLGFRSETKWINPNNFSFHCDSTINEKDLKDCLTFLFSKYFEWERDVCLIAYQPNKFAIPYRFTTKPSYDLYKIPCDSLYEKKYILLIMYDPLPGFPRNIEAKLHGTTIEMHKDSNGTCVFGTIIKAME
jgi:hypothetical protein